MKINKIVSGTIFILFALFLFSCLSAPDAGDEQDLAAIMTDYGRLIEEGDIEGWLALYDKDVIKMAPNAPSFGYDKMAAGMAKKQEMLDFISFECINEETVICGEYGWNKGNYKVRAKIKANGKEAPPTNGKYLTIFRRDEQGNWKIYRDCFNSNLPLPQ